MLFQSGEKYVLLVRRSQSQIPVFEPRTARLNRSSLTRKDSSACLRSVMSVWTHTQCFFPDSSRTVMCAKVVNGLPSFLRLLNSPSHDPFAFNCSMIPSTILEFSSDG